MLDPLSISMTGTTGLGSEGSGGSMVGVWFGLRNPRVWPSERSGEDEGRDGGWTSMSILCVLPLEDLRCKPMSLGESVSRLDDAEGGCGV